MIEPVSINQPIIDVGTNTTPTCLNHGSFIEYEECKCINTVIVKKSEKAYMFKIRKLSGDTHRTKFLPLMQVFGMYRRIENWFKKIIR